MMWERKTVSDGLDIVGREGIVVVWREGAVSDLALVFAESSLTNDVGPFKALASGAVILKDLFLW